MGSTCKAGLLIAAAILVHAILVRPSAKTVLMHGNTVIIVDQRSGEVRACEYARWSSRLDLPQCEGVEDDIARLERQRLR